MTDDPIIYVQHLQELKLCVRGAKQWFRLHGLDFTDFLTNGVPCSRIEKLDDALAQKVVKYVREEEQ